MMNTSPEVDAWFESYDNPQKAGVQRVREIILAVDPRITETIKWKAPTFMFEGNIASFFPRAKKHVSLMFHTGASIPGDHSLLEGGKGTSKSAKFADLDDIEAKKDELEAVIRAWIELKGG